MKKLCFVILNFNFIGGIEKANANLINELNKLGLYDITLLSIFGKQGKEPFEIKETANFRIKYLFKEEFQIKHFFKRIFNRKVTSLVFNTLENEILSNSYDIVITGHLNEYLAKIRNRNKKNFKLIIWEHMNCTYPPSLKRDLSRLYALIYADKLIVLTKRDKMNYIKKFGFEHKIIQIYHPISFENKCYSDLKQKKILTVGRAVNQKGIDMLIEIGKKIVNQSNGWSWDIYGDGDDLEYYKKKVVEEGLQNFIHFYGNQNNMKEIYPNYSIFASTSRYEGLPLVLLEAYSYHLPLISFNYDCGPSEVIINNENGFLIPCYDCDNFASKLLMIIKSYELREKFSKNLDRKNKEYSLDYVLKQWVLLFEELKTS